MMNFVRWITLCTYRYSKSLRFVFISKH